MSHRFAKQFQFNTAALHKKYLISASEWTCRAWAHNTGSKILNLSDYLIIFLTLMETGVFCTCRAIVQSRVDIGTAGVIARVRAQEVAKGRGSSVTARLHCPRWTSAFRKCREEICHENDSIYVDCVDCTNCIGYAPYCTTEGSLRNHWQHEHARHIFNSSFISAVRRTRRIGTCSIGQCTLLGFESVHAVHATSQPRSNQTDCCR